MRFVSFILNKRLTIAPESLISDTELQAVPFCELPEFEDSPYDPTYAFDKNLQKLLFGKLLLLDEINLPLETIHKHFVKGFVKYNPGLSKTKYGWQCNRCGNEKDYLFASFSCFRCKSEKCVYCRNCIMMGRVSTCTPLISWIGPELKWSEGYELVWNGELSEGQEIASKRFLEKVGSSGEMLIWAVCGAGKTEVLFKGIEKALKEGLRVCIATPRTDVVLELAPRLKTVFPNTSIASFYGGSEEREIPAQLIISTTHQLYRFKQAFNMMIIDEVDAFPYSYDHTLQYAAATAVKTYHFKLHLSATPSTKMKKDVNRDNLSFVKIPKRFHGFPLPVPKIVWSGEWKKRIDRGKLPPAFIKWLKSQVASGRRAMIFVPSVSMIAKLTDLVRKHIKASVDFVHAEDPLRKEKVASFRRNEISLLVTTTILERGVTVPFLDVAVFGADHNVFSESALVQMAGRAGRNKEDYNGQVFFFHYGKSLNMLKAVNHIKDMNKEAGF
ncbi:DEAD/DEAH box helicase [Bacillus sp. NEB1478]|uniref:DEAD/DEAH box helicase n=1 Tax=Bacillus sp. NEB1478 TaxID=3073816 RepID=UPI002873E27B|nr:DEAD/DEAH box helicase [Bacillus sp. NEB1478]WNB92710.1 DEAD/DEAH box helicase [Bacillus sp. NEB1478]